MGARCFELSRLHHGRRQPLSHQLGQRRDRDARSDGAVLWEQDALQAPRPHRARASMATRWSSATSRATCTGSTRRPARSSRARRPTASASPTPRSTTTRRVFVQTDSGKLLAFKSQVASAKAKSKHPRLRRCREPSQLAAEAELAVAGSADRARRALTQPACSRIVIGYSRMIDHASCHRSGRSAERRQVDAVQLPDAHARRVGRGSARAHARPQVRLRQSRRDSLSGRRYRRPGRRRARASRS